MGLVQLGDKGMIRPVLAQVGIALLTASLVVVGCGNSDDDPAAEATGTTGTTTTEQPTSSHTVLGITKRPRTSADELPRYAEESAGSDLGGYEVDPKESRYVGEREGVRLYLVPGPRDVCLFTADGAGGCATQAEAVDGRLVGAQIGPPLLAEGEVRVWGTVPDGPSEVTASFDEGPDETVAVEDNVWVIRTRRTLDSISWQSSEASGSVDVPAF